MKKNLIFGVLGITLITAGLAGCTKSPIDGSYDFVIYESDSDNNDLSDNIVVKTYSITYVNCSTVVDSLIKDGNKYYFNESKIDYLVLESSTYGMMYISGYFSGYKPCSNGEIDVSLSATYVNGEMAMKGISDVPLKDLITYGFVLNAWAN